MPADDPDTRWLQFDFQIRWYPAPIWFEDSPPYQFPVESAHTYDRVQLGTIPFLPTLSNQLVGVYSNTGPTYYGQNEVVYFARDPDEVYQTFSSDLQQADPTQTVTNWDCNADTSDASDVAPTLPDALGQAWPLVPDSTVQGEVTLNVSNFISGNTNVGIRDAAVCGGFTGLPGFPETVKAAYIEKHGTCSRTQALKPILSQIDQQIYRSVGSSEGLFCGSIGANPTVPYVHSIAWMTEGDRQTSPTKGGFILALWVSDFGDAALNVTYTFGLDTAWPHNGILNVTPTENGWQDDGIAGSGILGSLRQGLENTSLTPVSGSCGSASVPLPGALENQAFSAQANPLPALSGTGSIPCTISGDVPTPEQIASDPNIPYDTQYCPTVGIVMSGAVASGADRLHIPAGIVPSIQNTLLAKRGGANGADSYWSNFRCNFQPSYSRAPTSPFKAPGRVGPSAPYRTV